MPHRDLSTVVDLNADCLRAAIDCSLRGARWSGIKFRKDCTWTPRLLTIAALCWAWSDELTLVSRFQAVRTIVLFMCPRSGHVAGSYQAFTKMLRRWTGPLIGCLQTALRRRMQQELKDCWLVLGWVLFGVDGSRAQLPRTRSNEQAYSANRKGRRKKAQLRRTRARRRRGKASKDKKANSPQLWLTTLWHVGAGLPWDWRIGPADSSERAHLLEMLPGLPAGALIAADAGFVGYEYARAILDSGRQLLLRVGSNVRLLKQLGYARETSQTVYLWPDKEARGRQPPLVLRLVVAHNGKHPVFLVTSLPASQLSNRQVVELYARRWGIEVFYRHLKQTFQRRKLRSGRAENAHLEMQWSLAGLWTMALYALVHLKRQGFSPQRLSIAKTLYAFRRMLRDYRHPIESRNSLRERLRRATIDAYQRVSKQSRDYPAKKQERPPGPPKIKLASGTQIQRAQEIRRETFKKRLTA